MIDEQLVNTIAEAFRADGYSALSKQKSSRSVTVSATKGERRAVVHITDPEPAPGPRSAANADAPASADVAVRPFAPSPGASGSGTNGSTRRARTKR